MRKIAEQRKASNYRIRLVDGRTIEVHYEPMIDGGWVVTHQDVTEIDPRRGAHQPSGAP